MSALVVHLEQSSGDWEALITDEGIHPPMDFVFPPDPRRLVNCPKCLEIVSTVFACEVAL